MKPLLKSLERALKRALALAASLLLWRPGHLRRAQAGLVRRRRLLVVRVDDRVGEAVLLTPVLSTLKTLPDEPRVDVLVHPRCVRLLEGHPDADQVIAFERQRGWWLGLGSQMRVLRQRRYDVVIDQGNWAEPSVTHALLARLCGPHSAILGSALFSVRGLRTHPAPAPTETRREVAGRLSILAPLGIERPVERTSYRPFTPSEAIAPLLDAVRSRPHAVLNPGGRLDWRRVPPEIFIRLGEQLIARGITPVVTWGPREEGLARYVADALDGALFAPSTTLDDLAALMLAAGRTVCNNTGPMHLSVAVGVPTLQLFLHMDPIRWGYPDPPHRILDCTSLVGDDGALHAALAAALDGFLREEGE